MVDASDPNPEKKMEAEHRVLLDLELSTIPRLVAMNKADAVEPSVLEGLCRRHDAIGISALHRQGLDRLMEAAEKKISNQE